MKTSELLRRKILETHVGAVLNKFRINKRRDCLFFGDIFMDYIRECEKAGHSESMFRTGKEWMGLYFDCLVPDVIKRLPDSIMSRAMEGVWKNHGLMDSFSMKCGRETVEIRTENEAITGKIGENEFSVGLFAGICSSVRDSEISVESVSQGSKSRYVFGLVGGRRPVESKGREKYNGLNFRENTGGTSLEDALRKNVLRLSGNMIYFRGKPMYAVENTLFHLVGRQGLMMDKITDLSFGFFNDVIEEDAGPTERMRLLKTMLQATGWGVVKIISRGKEASFHLFNPPFGLQRGEDNWDFLAHSVLGYLRAMDRRAELGGVERKPASLKISYRFE